MAEISHISPHIVAGRVVSRVRGTQEKTETDARSPIAMFDSGVGGLTVLEQVKKLLPHEDIIYLADTARVPYGGRSPSEIIKINKEIIGFFIRQGAKMIVMACGTSSSIAYPLLKDKYPVPIIGIIEGGARMAVRATRNNRIGVIATMGTVNSRSYEVAVHAIKKEAEVFSQACPLLVPLIEGGFVNSEETEKVLKDYLKPLTQKKIDTLVLGCTHYPHLTDMIKGILGPEVIIVDPAEDAASTVKETLTKGAMLNSSNEPVKYRYIVTGSAVTFQELASRLMGRALTNVEEAKLPLK